MKTFQIISPKLLRLSLLLGLLLSKVGCVSLGVPERFSATNAVCCEAQDAARAMSRLRAKVRGRQSARPITVVVSSKSGEKKNSDNAEPFFGLNNETLGYQFLFGVFPFSRLYFPHGPSSQFRELLIQNLSQQGYLILDYFSPEPHSSHGVLTDASIEFNLNDAGLATYDALFFRVAHARLKIDVEFGHQGNKTNITYDESLNRIKSRGDLMTMSGLFAEVSNTINGDIVRVIGRMSPQRSESRHLDSIAFVLPPTFPRPVSQIVIDQVSTSYGIEMGRALDDRVLGRLIQRGFSQGVLERRMAVNAVIPPFGSLQTSSLSLIDGLVFSITGLEMHPRLEGDSMIGIRLLARIDIVDNVPGNSFNNSISCVVEVNRPKEIDAVWIVAIEEAARAMSHEILGVRDARTPSKVPFIESVQCN